jgi:hypothetical protein
MSAIFFVIFAYLMAEAKNLRDTPETYIKCIVKNDINRPIFITADTDLDEVKDVSTDFYGLTIAGLALNLVTVT